VVKLIRQCLNVCSGRSLKVQSLSLYCGLAVQKQYRLYKRAQYYWRLRDRFYKTFQAVTKGVYIDPDELISLSSDIDCLDQLRAEVCRVPKKPNPNGLIQIMSKADMVKMEIGSPNMADSLMMSMMIPQSNEQFEPINFTSEW